MPAGMICGVAEIPAMSPHLGEVDIPRVGAHFTQRIRALRYFTGSDCQYLWTGRSQPTAVYCLRVGQCLPYQPCEFVWAFDRREVSDAVDGVQAGAGEELIESV